MTPSLQERWPRVRSIPLIHMAASIHNSTSGVYFLILYDKRADEAVFFADTFSCKKIFYRQRSGSIEFSTTVRNLVSQAGAEAHIDLVTAATMLMYDYVPTGDTLVTDIKSVRSFSVYSVKQGLIEERHVWPFQKATRSITLAEAARGTYERLENAFLSGTRGFDSLVIPLSGGRDSRLLLALALKHRPKREVCTFTFGQRGSLDYEIGTGLARELGLQHRAYELGDDFYEAHVLPSTPFMNGLTNHFLAPSDLISHTFDSSPGQAVVSGYIGDLVIGWKNGRVPILRAEGVRYPAPKQLSLQTVTNLLPEVRDELLQRLAGLQADLDDCSEHESMLLNDWYYRVRVTAFTTVGLFSEQEEGLAFVTPFVDLSLLEWVFSLPSEVRADKGFYQSVLGVDDAVAPLFRYPLKNANGLVGIAESPRTLSLYARHLMKAWRLGVSPRQNFLNYAKAYPRAFVVDQVFATATAGDYLGLDREDALVRSMDYSQLSLLLSLRLHLDCLLGRDRWAADILTSMNNVAVSVSPESTTHSPE